MNNIRVFGIQRIPRFRFAGPWQLVIAATARKSIVPNADNPVADIHDASTNLCIGVFAPLSGQKCYAHEIIVPRQVLIALMRPMDTCI